MNESRRRKIKQCAERLKDIGGSLENVAEAERMAFDLTPESLQNSDRSIAMENNADRLEDIVEEINDIIDEISEM
ncbi:putative alpha-E superfamily protein [Clostridiales Family XIII bacterium PM5-7]